MADMNIDGQADFLLAAFDVWWMMESHVTGDLGRRALALAAFAAGVLATDSLLLHMKEEQAAEAG